MPFKVHKTEDLLQQKLGNLCTKLVGEEYRVDPAKIEKLKAYMSADGATLTSFAQKYLVSAGSPVDTRVIAVSLVSYASVTGPNVDRAVELVESYLNCFADLVC
jgi:hypothetical protein